MQSPKSKRPSAPGETPHGGGNSETKNGGHIVESQGVASAHKSRTNPGATGSGFGGSIMSEVGPTPTGPVTPSQGGGPGFASFKEPAKKSHVGG